MDVPIAANVLGTLGAVCWSIQLIPQIVINYRRHNAIGLQPTMMMLWAWAGVPLGVYNIVEEFNIALRCYYYERKWTIVRSLAVVVPIACIMGGIEAALIVALRIAKDQDLDWPLILMAVLSASLLAAGVLRHYWDIYVHRTVRGISFLFVGIDAAGDVFSLVSVIFQPKLDILGLVIYGSELILWIGVFACGGYYNLTPWARKKLANSTNGNASSAAQSSALDGADHATARVGHSASLTLHDMPSSTSVFRTPSGEVDIVRQRANRERE